MQSRRLSLRSEFVLTFVRTHMGWTEIPNHTAAQNDLPTVCRIKELQTRISVSDLHGWRPANGASH